MDDVVRAYETGKMVDAAIPHSGVNRSLRVASKPGLGAILNTLDAIGIQFVLVPGQ
jgi:DNA-binding phage protein